MLKSSHNHGRRHSQVRNYEQYAIFLFSYWLSIAWSPGHCLRIRVGCIVWIWLTFKQQAMRRTGNNHLAMNTCEHCIMCDRPIDRLSVWGLSVCLGGGVYIGPKLRTERRRKTKIGTEVTHVTRDSDTIFKVKRFPQILQGAGHIVATSRTAC